MRSRRFRALFITVGIVAVVALLAWMVPVWIARRAEAFEVERAKAEGVPLTFADIPASPPLSLVENAAPDYESAISKYVPWPEPPFPAGQAQAEALNRRYVHENFRRQQSAIAAFFTATAKPRCDFGFKLPQDHDRKAQDLQSIHSIVKLVDREALAQADDGAPLDGLNLLWKLAPVVSHIAETPDSVWLITSFTNGGRVLTAAQRILDRYGRVPGVPEEVAKVARRCVSAPDFAATIELENVSILAGLTTASDVRKAEASRLEAARQVESLLADFGGTPSDTQKTSAIAIASYVPGIIDRWRTNQWRLTRRELEALRGFKGDWMSMDHELSTAYKTACLGVDGLYSMHYAGDFGFICVVSAGLIARRRVTEQAAAVMLAWNRTGKIPASLPLGGDFAKDPRANSRLHYKATGVGFQIYAVGDSGVDYGGDARRDVVFDYPSPYADLSPVTAKPKSPASLARTTISHGSQR